MAIQATVTDAYGEQRNLYIRLNNIESSNHGVASYAKFRGFLSQGAFSDNRQYLWEQDVEFIADVSQSLWPQAYDALKQVAAFADAVDLLEQPVAITAPVEPTE